MIGLGTVALVMVMFGAMVALEALGVRIGRAHRAAGITDPGSAAEGAVFAVLGLFLAFTFSGAANRFDQRRQLIVQEANAVGTAWLRIDILPADRQPAMRDLFRKYLDARLDTYRLIPDLPAVEKANARAMQLQHEIWSTSVDAARASGETAPYTVYLASLNPMIDITTSRTAATRFHPPTAVFLMIGLLTLIGAVFVGYGAASAESRSWLHTYGFAAVLAATLYVTFDLEYPRLGLIRVDAADQILVDVRAAMGH